MVNSITAASPVHRANLAAQESSPFEPSKPTLIRMIDFHGKMRKTGEKSTHLVLDQLERSHKELQFWSKEQLEKSMNQTWTESAWSYFETASTTCLSLFNFFVGTYLFGGYAGADQVIAGSALLAAGALEVMQILFKNYDTWDWIAETLSEKNQELKERLKKELPLILSFLHLACSGIGTVSGAKGLAQFETALTTLKNALTVATQAGQAGSAISQGYSAADNAHVNQEIELHKHDSERLLHLVEVLLEELKRIKTSVKKPIDAKLQATMLAARKFNR